MGKRSSRQDAGWSACRLEQWSDGEATVAGALAAAEIGLAASPVGTLNTHPKAQEPACHVL